MTEVDKMNAISKNITDRVQIWLPLMLAVMLGLGILIGARFQTAPPQIKALSKPSQADYTMRQGKIEELLRYIDAKYVDKIDRDKLIEEAINSIINQLDPHSSYIPASFLRDVNEQLEGRFKGIGVEFLLIRDTVVVVTPMSSGPAAAAGVLAGDKIIKIGDTVVAGKKITTERIINLMRGETGSKVNITVLRPGEKKIRNFSISREEIPVNSIDAAYPLDDRIGYIKINKFSASTSKEFIEALQKLSEKDHIKDLIIDLRQNPGGYMQMAADILSQLIPEKGKLLFYTEGRASSKSKYTSTGRAYFRLDQIVVLIDEGTASASEILAGALQDQDRGVVIGRRSFGKGLVQEQYDLSDGSALRLTMARYYTPSGRSIQKSYKDLDAYETDLEQRYKNGEFLSATKMKIQDSTRYFTSQGRIVYGGSGIIPDVFVPFDSIQYNAYYLELRRQIPTFSLQYVLAHQAELKKYSLGTFKTSFPADDVLLTLFKNAAEKNGVAKKDKEWTKIKNEIAQYLRASLASQLFGSAAFFKVSNDDDTSVQTAIRILKKKTSNPLSAYQLK
jgi:carboxyl-terminal processing protease